MVSSDTETFFLLRVDDDIVSQLQSREPKLYLSSSVTQTFLALIHSGAVYSIRSISMVGGLERKYLGTQQS